MAPRLRRRRSGVPVETEYESLSGVVTGWQPGRVVLNRRRRVRIPREWVGAERMLLGQSLTVTGRAGDEDPFLADTIALGEAAWNQVKPGPAKRTGAGDPWPALEPMLAWLRQAGWPTVARRLGTGPLREQMAAARDPYKLIGPRGLSFQAADFLALDLLGLSVTDPVRVQAAMRELVQTAYTTQHGGLPVTTLTERTGKLLDLPGPAPLPDPLPAAIAVREGAVVYDPRLAQMRRAALDRLTCNQQDLFGATEEDAVAALTRNRYAVLTGQAGSGKSTALRQVAAHAREEGLTVQLCGLTGKAASELGDGACTLHRLLQYHGGRFLAQRLTASLILVDEASMLTWPVLWALLRVAPGKIIFCGDAAQLPPVSGDPVFQELVQRLPVLTLAQAHRFVGRELPVTTVRHTSATRLLDNLVNLVSAHWRKGRVQVLTPVHFSPLGTVHLNQLLQNRLNPEGRSLGRFRVGDRVIVTRNCYDTATPAWNGQAGDIIGGLGPTAIEVRLSHGQTVTLTEADVDLAYCLTVHKAQGSQYDIVLLVLPKTKLGTFIDEKLEYVGCSRARHRTYCLVL